MFVNLNNDTKCAKNVSALNKAADRLARSLVTSTGEIVGGLTGTWGIRASGGDERIATGLKTIFTYGKRQISKVPASILQLTIKRPNTTNVKYPESVLKNMSDPSKVVWPPQSLYPNGAIKGSAKDITLPAGTILDRFGSPRGRFFDVCLKNRRV